MARPLRKASYFSTMNRTADDLRDAVARAITTQLPGEIDERDLPRQVAIRLTADRLVREALAAGHAGRAEVSEVTAFGSGNTAMVVATVRARMAYVVKVDTQPSLVREAHLLQRMASDPLLPKATRDAFPVVYAIDDTPPVYGYLMELIEGGEGLHEPLRRRDPGAADLLAGCWDAVLEPAYESTCSARLAHNLHEDYFVRARSRLQIAAQKGVLPGPDVPLQVDDGQQVTAFKSGWGPLLQAAHDHLERVRPPFGTWVHGDPNPENVICTRSAEAAITFRLLDPKDWWTGDYLFDVAKLTHYAALTAQVEGGHVTAALEMADDVSRVRVDRAASRPGEEMLGPLRERVSGFAARTNDREWCERHELAVAANLLGIAGPRAERAEQRGTGAEVACAALAVGLLTLHDLGVRS
jgi:hypothetical protein